MKLSFRILPLLTALSLAIGLVGCGGHNAVSIGGSVTGLTDDGLTLDNNGTALVIPAKATSYTFPNSVNVDSTYTITVVSQPLHQSCFVSNASGRVSGTQIDAANVSCAQNVHGLTGTITGFTGVTGSLVLGNGTIMVTPAAGATTFAFPPVADGTAYSIVSLPQTPPGQTCTVSNGTGVMGINNVTTVVVTCT